MLKKGEPCLRDENLSKKIIVCCGTETSSSLFVFCKICFGLLVPLLKGELKDWTGNYGEIEGMTTGKGHWVDSNSWLLQ